MATWIQLGTHFINIDVIAELHRTNDGGLMPKSITGQQLETISPDDARKLVDQMTLLRDQRLAKYELKAPV